MKNKQAFIYLCVFFLAFSAQAQEFKPIRDTLPAAVKEDSRSRQKTLSERLITARDFSVFASPTGEGDFVKLVQTLPGVASGSDGSSAYYVRGGNLGGNLQTLDGVPIYGSAHLIGLTTAYAADIIEAAEFQVGGFTSEEGNLSASHIKLRSKDGSYRDLSAKAQVSNLLLGGVISTPLKKDRLSLIASARVSPAQWEFNAIAPRLQSSGLSIRHAGAAIYDLYAKVKYRASERDVLSLSVFHSMDGYDFLMQDQSRDKMSWTNTVAILGYDTRWKRSTLNASASFNHYANGQGMIKTLAQTRNDLLIRSSINEWTLQAKIISPVGRVMRIQYGLKGRYAIFNPGSARILETTGVFPKTSSPLSDNTSSQLIAMLHGQWEAGEDTRHLLRIATRLNYNNGGGFAPEFSVLARVRALPFLGFELTGDYLTQYYHMLEGVPLGWSLDMLVPSTKVLRPEQTRQLYGGLYADAGQHHFSTGYYYKDMKNLVWYADATKLFDAGLAGWSENIDIGTGTSRGFEVMYEKMGDIFKGHLAYTWSRTDRLFPDLNKGMPFPAKYDRRHIFNATASVRIVSNDRMDLILGGLFTYQSGHWETVVAGYWKDSNFITGPVEQFFYTALNNYQMPPYIRCDLSAEFVFKGGKHPQTLNLGCFNILNRHNPFSLSYDTDTNEWKQVSLLPIMPSLKYSISF